MNPYDSNIALYLSQKRNKFYSSGDLWDSSGYKRSYDNGIKKKVKVIKKHRIVSSIME
jgi:hypothetical protein